MLLAQLSDPLVERSAVNFESLLVIIELWKQHTSNLIELHNFLAKERATTGPYTGKHIAIDCNVSLCHLISITIHISKALALTFMIGDPANSFSKNSGTPSAPKDGVAFRQALLDV